MASHILLHLNHGLRPQFVELRELSQSAKQHDRSTSLEAVDVHQFPSVASTSTVRDVGVIYMFALSVAGSCMVCVLLQRVQWAYDDPACPPQYVQSFLALHEGSHPPVAP
eukprot:52634-Eustigmatos_ZCMA.PRE.1